MTRKSLCLLQEDLETLAQGRRLPPDREAHIDECDACQGLLDAHEAFDPEQAKLRLLSRLTPPQPAYSRTKAIAVAISTVTIAVVACLGVMGLQSERDAQLTRVAIAEEHRANSDAIIDQLVAQRKELETASAAMRTRVAKYRKGELSAEKLATETEDFAAAVRASTEDLSGVASPAMVGVAQSDTGGVMLTFPDGSVTLPPFGVQLSPDVLDHIRRVTGEHSVARLHVDGNVGREGLAEAIGAIQHVTTDGRTVVYVPVSHRRRLQPQKRPWHGSSARQAPRHRP